jgi:transcriptional regulator with XRE-family HTH domain
MSNERLRAALTRERWTLPAFAEAISVDPKTVERWITKERTPHRRTAVAAAARLGEDPVYLWPDLSKRIATDETYGEVVTVYSERHAVPNSLWLSLLQGAEHGVDLLVYAGLHLPEANPSWTKEIETKCREGAKVRIAFGDPQSIEVHTRGAEEGVGEGMAARIQYALAWYRPILRTPNLEVRFHSTVLYNSILRFDDQMLVNAHIYGMPAFRAPVLHLRKVAGGPLFDTYAECFDKIWADARPFEPDDGP